MQFLFIALIWFSPPRGCLLQLYEREMEKRIYRNEMNLPNPIPHSSTQWGKHKKDSGIDGPLCVGDLHKWMWTEIPSTPVVSCAVDSAEQGHTICSHTCSKKSWCDVPHGRLSKQGLMYPHNFRGQVLDVLYVYSRKKLSRAMFNSGDMTYIYTDYENKFVMYLL